MTGTAAATSPVAEPIDPEVLDAAIAADPAAGQPIDANAADPSTVDNLDANEPASLLSVIRSAVEKPTEPEASSAPEGDPVTPKADDIADVAEPDAADDANLPFHNHPRWKAVIAERDGLKEPAEKWGNIDSFMQQHGLSGEEVAEGYEIMALLKSGDPDKLTEARGWFSERLNALDGMLGNVLPADLQTRVDEGYLDEDGAQELARTRAATALRETQEASRTEAATADKVQQDATARTNAMVSAVEAWEVRVRASDPDYAKKAKQVQDRCRSIVAETGKAPMNAAEATELADKALAEISAEFKAALPKPRPVTPAPAGKSTAISAQPTSLRGAIDAALGR